MKSVLVAAFILLPSLALGQSTPQIARSGHATGQLPAPGAAVSINADVEAAIASRVDTTNGVLTTPTVVGPLTAGNTQINLQAETLEGQTGSSAGYFGGTSFPQPNLQQIRNGHLQLIGQTGSWGSATNILTVNSDCPAQNNGNQGGFWNPANRTGYDGQDSAAIFVLACSRLPVVAGVSVSAFTAASLVDASGQPRTVYAIKLATPLTPAQVTLVNSRPPNLKVETSSGFQGFLIPSGYSLSPVSADGTTLVVDAWTRGSYLPGTSTPTAGVVPASAGALPPSSDTITLDTKHSLGVQYGGLRVQDGDGLNIAIGKESAFINNRSSVPGINLYDPMTSPFVLLGDFEGVGADNGTGVGAGTANHVATTGWQAAFVARNMPTAQTGPTYGFLVPYAGPTFGFYSTQGSGFPIVIDPGNSCNTVGQVCLRTLLIDPAGNGSFAGRVNADSLHTAKEVTATATLQAGIYTVATLPPCGVAGTEGLRAGVSDAATPTFLGILTGGGSVHAPAYCNGTNWVAG